MRENIREVSFLDCRPGQQKQKAQPFLSGALTAAPFAMKCPREQSAIRPPALKQAMDHFTTLLRYCQYDCINAMVCLLVGNESLDHSAITGVR
jgi:hypothetical protein